MRPVGVLGGAARVSVHREGRDLPPRRAELRRRGSRLDLAADVRVPPWSVGHAALVYLIGDLHMYKINCVVCG